MKDRKERVDDAVRDVIANGITVETETCLGAGLIRRRFLLWGGYTLTNSGRDMLSYALENDEIFCADLAALEAEGNLATDADRENALIKLLPGVMERTMNRSLADFRQTQEGMGFVPEED